jgi:hypothetical protein
VVHDFTLVYALNPELDSQDEVLRRLVGSHCADATAGVGLGSSRWPSVGRHWTEMWRSTCCGSDGTGAVRGKLVRVDAG